MPDWPRYSACLIPATHLGILRGMNKIRLPSQFQLFSLMILSVITPAVSVFAEPTLDDPYIWLESVDSAKAMQWVHAENDKTLAVLEKDPRYAGLYADALAIAESKDRIPAPSMVGGEILNFWQDADHVHGIWRRTTLESYQSDSPQWTTVLDLDALSKTEKGNWFWKGADFVEPTEHRSMVNLSDGGEDAVSVREFDLPTARFVENGFQLSRAKQRVAWEDENTLLMARAFDPTELTSSGYAYVVRRLKRGQALKDAQEVFRGTAKDGGYGVTPVALHDGTGHSAVVINRPLTTFEKEDYLLTSAGVAKLALPHKSQIQTMVDGKIIVSLAEDWTIDGVTLRQGSLVAVDLAEATQDPAHLKPVVIYAPGARESFSQAAATRDALIVTTLDNVRGRAFICRPGADGAWSRRKLDVADNATIGVADADFHSETVFLSVTGFLQPSSLWLADADSLRLKEVKTLLPKFDASRDAVEQFEAVSSDGTKVPYFVVHPVDMKLDGSNPTILNAYGGFQISETPFYSANIGKLWLEHGGVFVLANIRGGGEFGPAWHEAGLKTHRQLIYDDFASVARDLISRKITSPRRLGIEGGSNGGLLMGVELTQHPELWNAVDIQVPLLDMVRFEQIAAGESWVGEFGSVSNAQERAFLTSISPYANLHRGVTYPAPLVWTTTTPYDGDTAIKLYLREIGQVKLLTPQEEIELAARIKKGDKKAREQMIKANLRLVVKIAHDYENFGLPLLDLINEGNIGLMKAVERFDPAKGGKLSTYGSWWIKQSIKRALANQSKTIRLPVHLVDKISKMRRTAMKLQEVFGREPTDEELAEEMGMSPSGAWPRCARRPSAPLRWTRPSATMNPTILPRWCRTKTPKRPTNSWRKKP
jgi:prolyl oligopeptidase